jgi:membrane associated rhomboid family serine protease
MVPQPDTNTAKPRWRWPSWSWRLAVAALGCLLFSMFCDGTQWNEFPNLVAVRLNGTAALLGASGVLSGLVALVLRALGRRLGWRDAVSLLLAMLVNAALASVAFILAIQAAHVFA